ncbi:MAG: hypothetical protein MZV49_25170 [Rhodopseudomonas palustris]|nr:hypothetical protein [Rhodopseudomonas palustris]
MIRRTDDLRIREIRPLIPPAILLEELPLTGPSAPPWSQRARPWRPTCSAATDRRLVAVVGPCSIHDPGAALEYARAAARAWRGGSADDLVVVMRVYFEKPRTVGGLEGPHQRPGPRRELPHQRGPAPRAHAAARRQPSCGLPRGIGVPRHAGRRSTSPT